MTRYVMSGRFAVALAAVALLADGGAAQQPAPTPPVVEPASFPTPNLPTTVPQAPGQPVPQTTPAFTPPPAPPVVPLPSPSVPSLPPVPPQVRRFNFKIEPNTPAKDLLPTPSKGAAPREPLLTDDLTKVPEVEFQAKPEAGDLTAHAARQLAKINHLNAKKADAFMTELLATRPDLGGLPFAMGDDCRTTGERAKQFAAAVEAVRQALSKGSMQFVPAQAPVAAQGVAQAGERGLTVLLAASNPQQFWPQFTNLCDQQDAARSKSDKTAAGYATVARIAALMQMLAPESAELRLGLVKYLTAVPHPEATRSLARLAIFSGEDEVRLAAIDALKVRREKDYTEVLVGGLRYPWPAVAKRAADAIARLERSDLLPELVKLLEDEDPRMPRVKRIGWAEVPVVREMVKLNHHRNCVMCHAPASGVMNASVVTAEVAVQGHPLPTPAEGYRQSTPELMIRADVTYLRADFSTILAVGDAHPWPEGQRFDFLVRERQLTVEEVATYRTTLTPKGAGSLSPYHKAALAALRDLTGKDTAPTAVAWRELLGYTLTAQ